MLRLETLGGLALTDQQEERPQPRRRLALLARLAPSGAKGVSRDELLALLWPERDGESARHSLDQLLYETRRALGAQPTVGGATLRLDPAVVSCDLADWEAALRRADLEAAVALYRGPFLQGFFLNGSATFEQWADTVRSQLTGAYRRTLESLATSTAAHRKLDDSIAWRRRLAAEDRIGSRVALGLMQALAESGDRAGALEFFRVHERIVRAEVDAPPDPAVSAFAHSLRSTMVRSPESVNSAAEAPAAPMTEPAAGLAAPAPAAGLAAPAPAALPRSSERERGRRGSRYVAVAVAALALLLYGFTVIGRHRAPAPMQNRPHAGHFVATAAAATLGHARPPRHETTNIAAHELYERGGDPVLLRSDSGVMAAIGYLRRAVALDTNYAAAYATLASRYTTAAWGSWRPPSERRAMRARAEAAARRAIALDDSLADAHAELGYLLAKVSYDEAGAVAELEKAVSLDSAATSTYELLAPADELIGRADDAIAAARAGVSRNPLSPSANAELGHALYFGGHYDEALARLAPLASLRPPLRRVPVYMGEVYLATGRWTEAIAVLRPVANQSPLVPGLYAYALVRTGSRSDAMRVLTGMLADESAGRATCFDIAEVYIALGDYDRAFVWLDRSFDDYSLGSSIMGPLFARFRADPRFDRIRQRLGILALEQPTTQEQPAHGAGL
ncbi:MAG: BTAD domain-containing putative transcriptional regulator [Gemmatimonadaceae bacterium]